MTTFKTPILAIFLLLISCSIQPSCKPTKETANMKTPYEKTKGDKVIASGPIVYKNFEKKNGQQTNITELYLEQSIQDYFIKFCESKVSRKELEDHLSKQKGEIKTAILEVEFRDGSWDICDDNMEQQSRIGKYVVIWRIVE